MEGGTMEPAACAALASSFKAFPFIQQLCTCSYVTCVYTFGSIKIMIMINSRPSPWRRGGLGSSCASPSHLHQHRERIARSLLIQRGNCSCVRVVLHSWAPSCRCMLARGDPARAPREWRTRLGSGCWWRGGCCRGPGARLLKPWPIA